MRPTPDWRETMKTIMTPVWFLTAVLALGLLGCGEDNDVDAGTDAGPVIADSGVDAGPPDAGPPPDADLPDAGPQDAGPEDAGPYDSGVPRGRSFRGQPPTVPHDAYGCGIGCLSCHATGLSGAPMTTHPERRICTMCHLFADYSLDPYVPNRFRP